jgi:hypothetical protein
MPWRSWFQLVFGPTESKRWNGFDARTQACSHRGDGHLQQPTHAAAQTRASPTPAHYQDAPVATGPCPGIGFFVLDGCQRGLPPNAKME